MSTKDELIKKWEGQSLIKNKKIIEVFKEINREDFIRDEEKKFAYEDSPLEIGYGQTISQPTTIVLSLDFLELKDTDRVLEIGAGSGYNAALISKLAKEVYSIEIIRELAKFAEENLKKAGIKNVKIICGDGSLGYSKKAPYDKIIITAATKEIPPIMIDQLKEGGILLAPVGDLFSQVMTKVKKIKNKLIYEEKGYFRFVPLRGKYGFK